MPTVAVVGAGIAGLSVAHELACRGYSVTVYETRAREAVGGKCRSQTYAHSGGPLPGEHGFRFFPGFYLHVPETMARIPQDPATADPAQALSPYADSVADRLEACDAMGIARPGEPMAEIKLAKIDTAGELLETLRFMWTVLMPVRKRDVLHLSQRFLRYLCTCDERRLAESGNQTLWDYVGADTLHPETQRILQNVPRSLVAMDAKQGNTRTFFNTLWLMNSEWMTDQESHRVLNGPSSAVWLEPWRDWIERLGGTFEFETDVVALQYDGVSRRVTGLKKRPVGGGPETIVNADHVVLAVPIEVAQTLVTPAMASDCQQCERVLNSAPGAMLGWMAGAQFYLRQDAPLLRGHIGYVYSPWGLTSVSQGQFWEPHHLASHPDVGSILSVCVTTFDVPDPVSGKTAMESSPDEMRETILRQIRECLVGHPDEARLDDANIVDWHLDDDLSVGPTGVTGNRSRLLIHPPAQWEARPEPVADIGGFYFAGDYVRNTVDLATMEGATAAARNAANGVLDADASPQPRVPVYDLLDRFEPELVKNRKALDQVLFDNGLEPVAIGDFLHPLLDDQDDPDDLHIDQLLDLLRAFDVRLASSLAAAGSGGGSGSPPVGLFAGLFKKATRAFAFPVFIPMARADQDAWTHLIGRYRGVPPAPGRHIGLFHDISALASDNFDPTLLHAGVRQFYTETTRFKMTATVRWSSPVVGRVWSSVADLFDQLDPGPVSTVAPQEFHTNMAALTGFPESIHGARLWQRRLGEKRREFYTSIARPYLGPDRSGGTCTYLNVVLPFFFGNLSIVMELSTTSAGGLTMTSRLAGSRGRDTGMWLVPATAPWAAVRAPFADGEELTVEPTPDPTRLLARHSASAFGRQVLSLTYDIVA